MAYYPNNRWSPAQAYIFGGILLAMGLFLCRDIMRARWAGMSWTRTRATVTGHDLRCSHSSKGGTSCNAYIDYEYQTDDGYYTASNIEVLRNSLFSGRGLGDDLEDNFPEGRLFDVYYNPRRPSQSDLGPGNAPNPLIAGLILVGGVLLIATGRDA